jgi:hypothetical protein
VKFGRGIAKGFSGSMPDVAEFVMAAGAIGAYL